jgi:pimeloyl-ACP methyl ester carboxylesterase
MFFMPFQVLGVWLRGLVSLALLVAGGFLIYEWYAAQRDPIAGPAANDTARVSDERGKSPALSDTADDDSGAALVGVQHDDRRELAYLVVGVLLLVWSLGGGLAAPVLLRRSGDAPAARVHGTSHRLQRPDGTTIHAAVLGPADGIPLILTHGWGLDNNEFCYVKEALAARYRLIVWDLPGLGRSTGPTNKDWSLEKLANDLNAVIDLAGGRPAILVGHSIGGMIMLTFCRLFPQALGSRVSGLVLAQTTPTNPVKTTSMAALYTALQKPVLEPLCHLMVWLAPVVWLLNWMSYLNGSAHRSTERSSFSGQESREQLKFITRYYVTAWPAVIARGMLGMFRYDATDVLPTLHVPTLIVAGDRDTTCKPEASAQMASAIPQSELAILPSAKHLGLFEHHGRFLSILGSFVDDRVAADPAKADQHRSLGAA